MTARVFHLVFFTVFLEFVGLGIILPILPFYVQNMGGSPQVLGWLLASFSIMQFFAAPAFAMLSDRFGRKKVIVLSIAGQALSMLVFALGTKLELLPVLFAARLCSGATAGNVAACQAVVADVASGADRVRGMGRVGAGIGLGFVAGPFLGATLIRFGPAAPALGAAAIALVGLAAVSLLLPETRSSDRRNRAGAEGDASGGRGRLAAHLLGDSRRTRLMAIYFLAFTGTAGLQVAAALLGQQRFGWAERESGYAFTLFGVVMMAVQAGLVGRLSRAVGELGALQAGAVGMAVGMAGLALAPSVASLVAALTVVAAGMGLVSAVVPSATAAYAGADEQGSALGVLQAAGGLARAVGPVWAGLLCARFSPSAPFFFASAVGGVSYALAASLRRAPHS